jgi:glycerate-2-kinase
LPDFWGGLSNAALMKAYYSRISTYKCTSKASRNNKINTVRKHLSAFKGGWLKKAYQQRLNLVLSDVMGDPRFIASGPTVPDASTFEDAKESLENMIYGCMPHLLFIRSFERFKD